MAKATKLKNKDGHIVTTSVPAEVVSLKSQGYHAVKDAPKAKESDTKPEPKAETKK